MPGGCEVGLVLETDALATLYIVNSIEVTETDLRSLQILDDGYWLAVFFGGSTDPRDPTVGLFRRGMAEVQSDTIGTCFDKSVDSFVTIGRRTDGRYYF